MDKYVAEAERGNVLFLPLKDYNNEFTDQRKYAYTLLIVAIGILLIAAINFTNLATAQSLLRTKEVGVRKVLGATKGGLVNQFLSESMLLVFSALILGGLMAELLLPYFNDMIGLRLDFNFISNPKALLIILMLGVVMGLLSGSYPSFYMSSFKPGEILKGNKTQGGSMLIRNGLVVLQFSLAIMLLSAVVIISRQVNYMKEYDLKFDRDNVVAIPLSLRDFENRDDAVARIISFKEELKQLPGVLSVTGSNGIPGSAPGNFSLFMPEGKEDINPLDYRVASIEEDYFDTFGFNLIAGRNFISNSQNDRNNSAIINQAAARDIGWNNNAIGKKLSSPSGRWSVEIVGIVEDFNYESLKQPVLPLVHFYGGDSSRSYRFISVRLDPKSRQSSLELMATTWEKMNFEKAYEYFFPAERMEQLYQTEENLIKILTNSTFFAMFIACLGLYALASFTVMLRTKEIAIRKVLGASVMGIVQLFSKKYLIMVFIALIIATPLAWYGMSEWLASFAYRTEIRFVIFLFTGFTAVVIAFITVSFHSIKAGYSNPVKSLRNE
jgi:putative ABC transport system permease protein